MSPHCQHDSGSSTEREVSNAHTAVIGSCTTFRQRILVPDDKSDQESVSIRCGVYCTEKDGVFIKNRIDSYYLAPDNQPSGWQDQPVSRGVKGSAEQYTFLPAFHGRNLSELTPMNSANIAREISREHLVRYQALATNGEVSITATFTVEYFRCGSCVRENTSIVVPLLLVFSQENGGKL